MRILTLSTLFPNPVQPGLGVNVARQVERIAGTDDMDPVVIAPLPRFPIPLLRGFGPAPYAGLASVPAERREGENEVEVHHPRYASVPKAGWRWHGEAVARSILPLARRLHDRQPFDLIACEYFFPDAWAAFRLSQALHLPYTVKARGSDIRYWRHKARARRQIVTSGRYAKGLLAVSMALKDDMVAMGLPRERIDVHHTGVDLDRFKPQAAPKAETPLLVCAGNLVPLKRVRLIIEALAALPEYRLQIIGDGPERAALEALAAARHVADRTEFLGRVDHAQLPARFAAAHALVHASESEGLANVWVEALACGTPVITTAVGGAADVVTQGAGILLDPDTSPMAIAGAVRSVTSGDANAGAARTAASRFSWARNIEMLRDHYARVSGAAG